MELGGRGGRNAHLKRSYPIVYILPAQSKSCWRLRKKSEPFHRNRLTRNRWVGAHPENCEFWVAPGVAAGAYRKDGGFLCVVRAARARWVWVSGVFGRRNVACRGCGAAGAEGWRGLPPALLRPNGYLVVLCPPGPTRSMTASNRGRPLQTQKRAAATDWMGGSSHHIYSRQISGTSATSAEAQQADMGGFQGKHQMKVPLVP